MTGVHLGPDAGAEYAAGMARVRTVYSCTHCGAQQPRWLGRCPECSRWNTLVEEPVAASQSAAAAGRASAPAPEALPIASIDVRSQDRLVSGIDELDRVLGGGFAPAGAVLLGGEPGIGKSTLALQLAAQVGRAADVLYVSGEESPEQIRLRAERLCADESPVRVLGETRVERISAAWRELSPQLVVVDSVQTLRCERVESAAGSVAQVRESAGELSALAKATGTVLVLIGHVTKDGTLAGPRVLEHLVDVVLAFEGERTHSFRLLRALKNRFGSTQEVGVFAMAATGLAGVENPSELFLSERRSGASGTCITALVEGTRPLLVEIQALVAASPYAVPRRTALGIEDGRVALLLAVLERHGGVDLLSRDVFVNVVGGLRVGEPGADLAVALAIASSRLDQPLPSACAACGELGLGGEVRRVPQLRARVAEAARLGFAQILVPRGSAGEAEGGGAKLIEVGSLAEALEWLAQTAS